MQSRHDELRDELVAILGASRELSPDVDHQLADAFLRALNQVEEPQPRRPGAVEALHQPHYSIRLSGAAWGAALMFLFCGLAFGHPSASQFFTVAVVLLALVSIATRAFLYMARHDWQVPHIRLVLPAARGTDDHRS
jgi:hypothetical protein